MDSENTRNDSSGGSESNSGRSGPGLGDVVVRAALGAATFTLVTAVLGPIAGSVAASLVSGGDDGGA